MVAAVLLIALGLPAAHARITAAQMKTIKPKPLTQAHRALLKVG
jgi:hypothetical protein